MHTGWKRTGSMLETLITAVTMARSPHDLACACEALLLVSREPLSLARLAEVTNSSPQAIGKVMKLLERRFHDRGIIVERTASGYRFIPAPRTAKAVTAYREEPLTLSDEANATLAIIAYLQPLTRAAITELRFEDPTHALTTLRDAGLIERASGDDDTDCYVTTACFLESADLASLDDLPCALSEEISLPL